MRARRYDRRAFFLSDPIMRKTPQEAAETRLKVVDAALKLFSRYGYSSTTLNMIARESGMSRGPIYWHFKNKDDLF